MQNVLLYRAWRVHSLLSVTEKVVVVSMRYGFLAAKTAQETFSLTIVHRYLKRILLAIVRFKQAALTH
jgi:hypothetical protein